MSVDVHVNQDRRFRIGRFILLASAALMTLNHLGLMFFLDEPLLFLGFSAFNVYSLLVIAIPFGRRERWAWYATWILPIGLAVAGFLATDVSILYYAIAAACVLGLLLTMWEFLAVDR